MNRAISRAELLRGRMTPSPDTVRPPYSIPESRLQSLCERCDSCRDACPTNVVGADAQGFPMMRFGKAACDFCDACVEACPSGALSLTEGRPWTVKAQIKGSCLSFNGITCRACEESCDEAAIRFKLMTEGRSLPVIDNDRCTGCGECAVICPNNAIDMRQPALEEVHA